MGLHMGLHTEFQMQGGAYGTETCAGTGRYQRLL